MEYEKIRRYLEQEGKEGDEHRKPVDLPFKFIEPFTSIGLSIDLIEPGRILCSFRVPPRLVNSDNTLHGGAIVALVDMVCAAATFTTGASTVSVSTHINASHTDAALPNEEVEIEAKALRVAETVVVDY